MLGTFRGEVKYEDAKYHLTEPPQQVKIKPRVAVLLVTFAHMQTQKEQINARSRRRENFQTPREYTYLEEDKFESLKFVLACHKHYRAGMDYDFYVIDQDSQVPHFLNHLRDHCKKEKVTFISRENTGFSEGAYKWFWESFPAAKSYDYIMYHEQDFGPSKDGWLKEIYDKFISDEWTGAVGNCIEGPRRVNEDQERIFKVGRVEIYNHDGYSIFTSTNVLREVDKIGGLNAKFCKLIDSERPDNFDIEPTDNEICWAQPILELGLKFKSFNDGNYKFTHGLGYLDWPEELDHLPIPKHLAPLISTHSRLCNPEMQKYYGWYLNSEVEQ